MKRMLRWILTKLQGEQPDGVTAFGRTLWFVDNPSPGLRAHEQVHRNQQAREGWLFYPRYLWQHVRHGYRGNRYEVEAYEVQRLIDEGGG